MYVYGYGMVWVCMGQFQTTKTSVVPKLRNLFIPWAPTALAWLANSSKPRPPSARNQRSCLGLVDATHQVLFALASMGLSGNNTNNFSGIRSKHGVKHTKWCVHIYIYTSIWKVSLPLKAWRGQSSKLPASLRSLKNAPEVPSTITFHDDYATICNSYVPPGQNHLEWSSELNYHFLGLRLQTASERDPVPAHVNHRPGQGRRVTLRVCDPLMLSISYYEVREKHLPTKKTATSAISACDVCIICS